LTVEHLLCNATFRGRQGEYAGLVGYPLFMGLQMGPQGVAFECSTSLMIWFWLRSMCPQQIGGSALRAEVVATDARNASARGAEHKRPAIRGRQAIDLLLEAVL
jgi:hypothetical protein